MSQTPRINIPDDKLRELCRRWDVQELSLFGSAIRDDFREDSDLDFLVRFRAGDRWSLMDFVQMKSELEDLFSRAVDLVEQDAIKNPYRRRHILQNRRVLYEA